MIVSNEPGYYKPGVFGVRIENLLEIVDSGMSNETLGRRYEHRNGLDFARNLSRIKQDNLPLSAIPINSRRRRRSEFGRGNRP